MMTEDVYESFSSNKEMFAFSNYSAKLKYYDDSNQPLEQWNMTLKVLQLKNLLDWNKYVFVFGRRQ